MTLEDLVRFVMRRILPMRERKRRAALIDALESVARQAKNSVDRGLEPSTAILNATLFFLVAERDIQAAKIDAITHPDPWHRSLSARVILLTIHGRDMDKVAGRRFRQALETIKAPAELKAASTDALRRIRKVQRKAEAEFDFLRNATIAHRDPDALAQYRAIADLDERQVLSLAADFYAEVDALVLALTRLITQSGTLPSVLAQIAQRGDGAEKGIT